MLRVQLQIICSLQVGLHTVAKLPELWQMYLRALVLHYSYSVARALQLTVFIATWLQLTELLHSIQIRLLLKKFP